MYPLLRLAGTVWRAGKTPPIAPDAMAEIHYRCMPWDLDIFMEMNNGRVLTLYDLGRFDLSVRIGLAQVLKKNRWGLVVAGSSIRYRNRIRMWDKVLMRTQLADVGERWIYLVQSMWTVQADGELKPASSLLIRTGVTSRGKVIPSDQVRQAMGVNSWSLDEQTLAWIQAWRESEEKRPWPPL